MLFGAVDVMFSRGLCDFLSPKTAQNIWKQFWQEHESERKPKQAERC